MANKKSAEKRARQSEKRAKRNRAGIATMRTAVKKLRSALESGDAGQAAALLPQTLKVVDTTASHKMVHRNTASRTKSRLTKAVRALAK
jgi:small subunit ribosomal protein S20